MGILWLVAFVLIAIGFAVMGPGRRIGSARIGTPEGQGTGSRRWGMHVLAAGTMLSLGLWARGDGSWSNQPAGHRVALLLGGVWALWSLGRAVVPLIVRRPAPRPFLPVAGEGARPPWLYLLLGWVVAVWLAWIAVSRTE